MENIYADFFSELKHFLIELGIDKKEEIIGCTESEILLIEEKAETELPVAYKEYLKSIGKYFLFEFFDAEQMSYDDFEDINEYVNDALEETNYKFDKKFFPISHRRYDYFRFIYLNESDNPDVWFFDEYPDNGIHIENSKQNFTKMILNFFSQILINKPFGFSWVSEEDEKKNKNIIRDRYLNWFKSLLELKQRIENSKNDNRLILELHKRFISYLTPENERTAIEELKKYNKTTMPNKGYKTMAAEVKNDKTEPKSNFWSKLKNWWS